MLRFELWDRIRSFIRCVTAEKIACMLFTFNILRDIVCFRLCIVRSRCQYAQASVCACVNRKGHESRSARDMKAAPQSASQRATLSKQGCYLTGDRKADKLSIKKDYSLHTAFFAHTIVSHSRAFAFFHHFG